jgi:hypothetical protein
VSRRTGSGKAPYTANATLHVVLTAAYWLDNRSGLNLVLSDLDRRWLRGLPGPGIKSECRTRPCGPAALLGYCVVCVRAQSFFRGVGRVLQVDPFTAERYSPNLYLWMGGGEGSCGCVRIDVYRGFQSHTRRCVC